MSGKYAWLFSFYSIGHNGLSVFSEEEELEESVELHGEDDIVFSQDSEHNLNGKL